MGEGDTGVQNREMSLLFDASAIINLSLRDKPHLFMGGKTVQLAEYEIGNAIWKQINLSGELNERDGTRVLRRLVDAVALMEIIRVPHVEDVLRIACEEDMSYYDAYYIAAAKASGSALVTDDNALRSKARRYTEVLSSLDF